ncbi:MAG: ABC transporter substrate-binding protein [Beijerinckiaceae bacterium]|nr:ABC transporter substrate-binding protein [Beijerinckiaceae bacterium]
MRRRDVLGLFCLAAIPAAAQPRETKTLAILMPYPETDAEVRERVGLAIGELSKLGWRSGVNLTVVQSWVGDDLAKIREAARRFVEMKVDAVLTTGSRVVGILKEETETVPVIFTATSDPVGRGFVTSLSHPGGNITGFALIDGVLASKLFELLIEIVPSTRRAVVVYNPKNPSAAGNLKAIAQSASEMRMAFVDAPVSNPDEIGALVDSHSKQKDTGLIFLSDLSLLARRSQVVAAVARNRVPAVYADDAMVTAGGLISFAPDRDDLFRRAATYVDRVLRGEKAGDLPVQLPARFLLFVNRKAADALGAPIPLSILARADEVIE